MCEDLRGGNKIVLRCSTRLSSCIKVCEHICFFLVQGYLGANLTKLIESDGNVRAFSYVFFFFQRRTRSRALPAKWLFRLQELQCRGFSRPSSLL